VQPVPPAHLELAQRLRSLRRNQWPDVRVTQAALAEAFSSEANLAAVTVSSWESLTSPKLPPRDRISAYARFFATRRSVEDKPYKLLPMDSLSEQERANYEELSGELLALHNAGRRRAPGVIITARRSWNFPDAGPATLICTQFAMDKRSEIADPCDVNFSELLSYADLDALVELHGHIRAENPTMDVFYKAAQNVLADDLSGHVILLGGVAWNNITKRLAGMIDMPVKQVTDPSLTSGEIFVVSTEGRDHKFFPRLEEGQHLMEDVGLLARVPNPLNSNRTLTICNGVHSRGVLGAVRSLTDVRLRESNEGYISENFQSSGAYGILMRVQVIQGKAMTPDFMIPDTVLYKWSNP
jgi:hypothetical protein